MEIFIFAFSFEAEMVVWQEAAEKAKAEGAPEPGRPRGLPRIGRGSPEKGLYMRQHGLAALRYRFRISAVV